MTQKRKKAEKSILDIVSDIDKSGINTDIYKKLFKKLTDEQFDNILLAMHNKEMYISIVTPPFSDVKPTYENNVKVLKSLGKKYFHKLTYTTDKMSTQSDIETLVFDVPIRRLAQLLTKNISVSEHNRVRNSMTGTVTGVSKSSKLSLDEVKILNGLGLKETINELFNVRGGDIGAERALTRYIELGQVPDLYEVAKFSTGVESTKSLKYLLLGAHIKLNTELKD